MTMSNNASHNIIETVGGHQESRRQLRKIESKEEFETKLNFQYVQKDLPKKSHAVSQQQQCPEKFMQTFNPKTDESRCSNSYHL